MARARSDCMEVINIHKHIEKSQEKQYFPISFEIPENIAALRISYQYPRKRHSQDNLFTYAEEINIIDLALNAPNGYYIGASGSDKESIFISEYESSEGYCKTPIFAGTWEILVGAYLVQAEGVNVCYTIEMIPKKKQLFIGDLHMHTTGSDGKLRLKELVDLAKQIGLDFICITNHNNYAENEDLGAFSGISLIEGTEWTHYNGHAGFLGIKHPYKNPFCINSLDEAKTIIEEARSNGAFIIFNHPFCHPECGWKWGFEIADYDAIELWNGPLVAGNENARALEWWHRQLCEGKHIVITGGSDFHRYRPFSLPGIPCTCVYANSKGKSDLLYALKAGNSYIKADFDAPDMEILTENIELGGTYCKERTIQARFKNIKAGDSIRIISNEGQKEIICPENSIAATMEHKTNTELFIRFEVHRQIYKGFPSLPILISNAIFAKKEDSYEA